MSKYTEILEALKLPSTPTLFLDLDAFEKNIQWVINEAGGKKIRIATKSLRSKEILKRLLKSHSCFQGLMAYDLREALWLRSEGFTDILMGYPTVDLKSLDELAKDPKSIVLMVDLVEHLELLEEIAKKNSTTFSLCLDIDLSMDLPGIRFGVYRSKVNSLDKLKVFTEKLKQCPHLKLLGLMGYEAQIAGVVDKESFLMRFLKKISLRKLQRRRAEFVSYLHQQGLVLDFVNGGGTGSLKDTREESVVTEITVGSGIYSPVLFDHYESFTLAPALAFTLPIVRHPEDHIYTCHGGGYIASGEVGVIKQPTPFLPLGMKLLKHEGAGEVQTPFHYSGEEKLKVGASVIMRHAKSGEVCERFEHIHLIRKNKTEEIIPTYRGERKTFV